MPEPESYRNKMESQKFSQARNRIVLLNSFINKFLGNNAASVNIKKAWFFTKKFSFKTVFYGLDTEPELEPESEPVSQLVKSRNRNRNK